jgi:hypothetical protein
MSSRVPATVASAVGGRSTIVIRYARPADGAALARLEELSSRILPNTVVLVAEADGAVIAAAPADGRGDAVTDPFLVTLDVVELLRLRSRQLRAAA